MLFYPAEMLLYAMPVQPTYNFWLQEKLNQLTYPFPTSTPDSDMIPYVAKQ